MIWLYLVSLWEINYLFHVVSLTVYYLVYKSFHSLLFYMLLILTLPSLE